MLVQQRTLFNWTISSMPTPPPDPLSRASSWLHNRGICHKPTNFPDRRDDRWSHRYPPSPKLDSGQAMTSWHLAIGERCYNFSLLWNIMTSLLLIAPTRSLSTHHIWHTYCALSQFNCGLSLYRLFLSWLLILTHFLWHLISDWLGLCARPISI